MSRDASQRVYPNIGIAEPHHSMSHHGNNPEKIANLLPEIASLPGYTPLMALRSAVSLTGAALEQQPTLDIPAEEVA